MNCSNAEKKIHYYREGELSSHQRRRLERHIAGCASCAGIAGQLPLLAERTRELRAVTPLLADPTGLTDTIMRQIAEESGSAARVPGPVGRWVPAALRWAPRPMLTGALAVLVLLLGIQELTLIRRLADLEQRMSERGVQTIVLVTSVAPTGSASMARMALQGGTGLAGDLLDAASDESVVLVRRADLGRLLAALGLAGDDDRVLEEMLTRRFPDLAQITLADGLTQQEVRRLLAHRTEIIHALRGL